MAEELKIHDERHMGRYSQKGETLALDVNSSTRRQGGAGKRFFCPDAKARQGAGTEDVGQRHIGGIAAARDEYAPDPRGIVAAVSYTHLTLPTIYSV